MYGDSNWKDLLTSYNGASINYDGIGNPTKWYDGTSFTWVNGRRLASAVNSSTGVNNSYTYNADGLRLTKTVNGVQHKYVWQGSQLVAEYYGGTELEFFYDESGAPYAFSYKANASATPVMYYYVTNLQGDVTNIVDASGNVVANYSYNAWGKVLTATGAMSAINPIRYRGYYYDSDTELYYLHSRYYDPELCRFLNADAAISGIGGEIFGTNQFSYCFNNPVNLDDSTGNWPQAIKDVSKWIAKKIVKPVVDAIEKAFSKVDATYSTGINISGTPSAFIFNVQTGVSVDTKGNVAIQYSAGGGLFTGVPGISFSAYESITNAPSIDKLEGPGYQFGGSVGTIASAGVDFNIVPDSTLNKTYFGVTSAVGLGTPSAEFHVEWGETFTSDVTRFNIFDEFEKTYIKIMEW